ncbi:hypothetical protein CS063_02235 [Sporanaerobium hydrogeniformans]|uniref:Uncharacterized protein n=1 Tax=Sporanaerobium hydrogeniformans TaxID=3072179 RepID=A0AC61DGL4_9FIRM|nr:S8 family serine peptidase [Sporanaerobium hydrogeniformans]PHV72316.1 hypothetical protein CS063_02235 [Sporanaerobium hydrogeniformans]
MKVIIEHASYYEKEWLSQVKNIHTLGHTYKLAQLSEEELMQLKEKAVYIEPAYSIQLIGRQEAVPITLAQSLFIIAYIGTKQKAKVDAYYDLETGELQVVRTLHSLREPLFISCYSETGISDATAYLCCVQTLVHLARQLGRPLLVYTAVKSILPAYQYRSLAAKITNHLLQLTWAVGIAYAPYKQQHAYYTPTNRLFEPYEEERLYVEDSFNQAIERSGHLLLQYRSAQKVKKNYSREYLRKSQALYEEFFYKQLPLEVPLYIQLRSEKVQEASYYEEMGFGVVHFEGHPIALLGEKSRYEDFKRILQPMLTMHFEISLVNELRPRRQTATLSELYKVLEKKGIYSGENVYIGLVTTGQVEAYHEALKDETGKSRLVYWWQQEKDEKGNELTNLQMTKSKEDTTFLLGLAGGDSSQYEGVASKAKFIVAQIKEAPISLQTLYGGQVVAGTTQLIDVLIGTLKLIEWAQKQGKPVVICLPFEGPLTGHGGESELERYLSRLGRRLGCTLIVSAGEEGNKRHHQCLLREGEVENEEIIEVKKVEQCFLGFIKQQGLKPFSVQLCSEDGRKILFTALEEAGEKKLGEGINCFSQGFQIDYEKGGGQLLFRIENLPVGRWRLKVKRIEATPYPIEMWLSSQAFSPFVRFEKATTFQSLNPLAASDSLLSVGAYVTSSKTLLGESGRAKEKEAKPDVVAPGTDEIAPCLGGWEKVSGTLVAMGLVAGVVASLYSGRDKRWNSISMRQQLLEWQCMWQEKTYPQLGYEGAFLEKNQFISLLNTPF